VFTIIAVSAFDVLYYIPFVVYVVAVGLYYRVPAGDIIPSKRKALYVYCLWVVISQYMEN